MSDGQALILAMVKTTAIAPDRQAEVDVGIGWQYFTLYILQDAAHDVYQSRFALQRLCWMLCI